MPKSIIFLVKSFCATFIDIWRFFWSYWVLLKKWRAKKQCHQAQIRHGSSTLPSVFTIYLWCRKIGEVIFLIAFGRRHSSVDLSVPSIVHLLLPQVQIPCIPSMLFHTLIDNTICHWFVKISKTENKRKSEKGCSRHSFLNLPKMLNWCLNLSFVKITKKESEQFF